jgi:S1-C subfamily serine protease
MRQVCLLAFIGALTLLGSDAIAQSSKTSDSPDSAEKIYDRTLHSTVWVLQPLGQGKARTGSGSLIDGHRRLILTNYHVVGDKDTAIVYFPMYEKGKLVAEKQLYMRQGHAIPGKVIVKDPKRDLALIQLEGSIPSEARSLKLSKDSPSPGQRVHSVGNPGASGALWIYTPGSVRQVYHHRFRAADQNGGEVFDVDAKIVETAAGVNQGDSGGPVVNDKGELVAVVQGHLDEAKARSYSIFIDVSEVWALLANKRLAKLPPPASEDKPKEVEPASGNTKTKPDEDSLAKKERDAARQLRYVKTFAAEGKNDLARSHCHEIIEKYPDTKAAKEAKELLEKLKD